MKAILIKKQLYTVEDLKPQNHIKDPTDKELARKENSSRNAYNTMISVPNYLNTDDVDGILAQAWYSNYIYPILIKSQVEISLEQVQEKAVAQDYAIDADSNPF